MPATSFTRQAEPSNSEEPQNIVTHSSCNLKRIYYKGSRPSATETSAQFISSSTDALRHDVNAKRNLISNVPLYLQTNSGRSPGEVTTESINLKGMSQSTSIESGMVGRLHGLTAPGTADTVSPPTDPLVTQDGADCLKEETPDFRGENTARGSGGPEVELEVSPDASVAAGYPDDRQCKSTMIPLDIVVKKPQSPTVHVRHSSTDHAMQPCSRPP